MSTVTTTWLMTEAQDAGRGAYSRAILSNPPYGVVDGTQRRDVSEALDLLALAETPFINRIGWGAESGGMSIEWITENLGPGYLNTSNVASISTSFIALSIDGVDASEALLQVKDGSVIYAFDSIDGNHLFAVITSIPVYGAGVTMFVSFISGAVSSTPANQKWYILGAYANEGSIPNLPRPRQRAVCSNSFTILRQDVQITGTMKSTDMYAIGREDRHQIMMRLKELQRDRERAALYSILYAKTSAAAGLMNGVYGFLSGRTGSNIDNSTLALTESAVNTVVSKIWENGGRNLTFFGALSQCAKFTRWDKNRIRTKVNESKGGGYIQSYLIESGIVIDLVPMANVPRNLAFVLDTSKIKLRAKRGRKAIMEKLGKMGDFDDWQILSEFTMEMKGYNLGQHGMFTALT